MLYCDRCGHENPAENYFCGHCGIPLDRDDQPIEPLARRKAPKPVANGAPSQQDRRLDQAEPHSELPADVFDPNQPSPAATVNGPSFLGLAESSEEESGLQYLYEDEPRHPWRWIITGLIVAALCGFLVYQRAQIPGWYTAITERAAHVSALVRAHLSGSITGTASAASSAAAPSAPTSIPEESQPATTANNTVGANSSPQAASAVPGSSDQPANAPASTSSNQATDATATSSSNTELTGNTGSDKNNGNNDGNNNDAPSSQPPSKTTPVRPPAHH